MNLNDDASHCKIPEFYKWKGPKMFANEDKCNSSGLTERAEISKTSKDRIKGKS